MWQRHPCWQIQTCIFWLSAAVASRYVLVCPCICLRASVLGNGDIVPIAHTHTHTHTQRKFQLGHCPSWTLSNLDIICVTLPIQKIFNLDIVCVCVWKLDIMGTRVMRTIFHSDIVWLGPCPSSGDVDIVWVRVMQTLSELPPTHPPTENCQLQHCPTWTLSKGHTDIVRITTTPPADKNFSTWIFANWGIGRLGQVLSCRSTLPAADSPLESPVFQLFLSPGFAPSPSPPPKYSKFSSEFEATPPPVRAAAQGGWARRYCFNFVACGFQLQGSLHVRVSVPNAEHVLGVGWKWVLQSLTLSSDIAVDVKFWSHICVHLCFSNNVLHSVNDFHAEPLLFTLQIVFVPGRSLCCLSITRKSKWDLGNDITGKAFGRERRQGKWNTECQFGWMPTEKYVRVLLKYEYCWLVCCVQRFLSWFLRQKSSRFFLLVCRRWLEVVTSKFSLADSTVDTFTTFSMLGIPGEFICNKRFQGLSVWCIGTRNVKLLLAFLLQI